MVKFARFVAFLTVARTRASWRLMLASGFGVLLAVTLTSVAAIHSAALAEEGLHYTITNAPVRVGLNLQIAVQDRPLGRQDYERLRSVADGAVEAHMGWLSTGMHRLGFSQVFPFVRESDDVPSRGGPVAYIFFQDEFQEHVRLVSGRWPQGPPVVTDEGFLSLEVTLGAEAAGTLGWTEGTKQFLVPFDTTPEEKVVITVVGIMEPVDPEDAYWFGNLARFRIGQEGGTVVSPLYVGDEGFFDGMGTHYPMLLGTYWWYVLLDVESLTASTASQARDSLESLEADINRAFPRSLAMTLLDRLIVDYQRDLSLARVPLFLFTFLVVGVVLYYLVVITVMLARHRGAEAAMIRSRGATVFQVGALIGLGEGLAVAVPAVLVGPFLGWGLARLLPVGGQGLERLSVGLSPFVVAVAAGAGLVCVAVFLAAGMGVARRSIVQFLQERARPPERPTVFRYAIDLLVLAAMALFWWQIRGRGGFMTEQLLGDGLEIDSSLLLGPVLALLAAGLVLLRVLPLVLRLLARLVDRVGPIWLVHGLKRVARDHLAS
ncbi:MAG: FtsX-like permease family protein, partial [Dehalococcoidia bacterium]